MTWHTATRQSSLFTFVTYYLYAEAQTAEEALRPYYLVMYGSSWPSHCIWMVPR
jgi:hypothetical protein